MTPKDKKFERIAQRHIADLKKSSKAIVEDATVRAVLKVMAEFAQGAHTEAKVEYHTTTIQCPHCDGSVRVPAKSYPDSFIDALKYDVAKRDSDTQPEQEFVACPDGKHCKHGAWCTETYCQEHCEFCAPPAQQEPVAWLIWLHGPAGHFDHKQFAELEFERRNKEYPDPDRKLLPLYTTPPQHTWVGLTDEEAKAVNFPKPGVCYVYPSDWEEVGLPFVRAIEAKLKEKNTWRFI